MATQCVTNLSHLKRRTLTEIEILSTGYSVWKTINTVKRLGLTYLSKPDFYRLQGQSDLYRLQIFQVIS